MSRRAAGHLEPKVLAVTTTNCHSTRCLQRTTSDDSARCTAIASVSVTVSASIWSWTENYTMSDFRARRPASPPIPASSFIPAPASSQRFPRKAHGYVDADERRATATAGPLRKPHPIGGLSISSAEFKLLIGICLLAVGVRLFRISFPNSVV